MKLSLPTAITVVVLGAGTGCSAPPTPPTDNPDGGPRLCPEGCFAAKESDGGYLREADGGIVCFC